MGVSFLALYYDDARILGTRDHSEYVLSQW